MERRTQEELNAILRGVQNALGEIETILHSTAVRLTVDERKRLQLIQGDLFDYRIEVGAEFPVRVK